MRRTILLVKNPGYAVVLDSVRDLNAPHFNRAISQYWHAPTPFQRVGPDRVRTRGRRACLLLFARREGLHRLDTGTDFAGAEVAHYRDAYARYCLRARRWMAVDHHPGILGFTTVLYPFTGRMPPVTVRALPVATDRLWKMEVLEVNGLHGRDRIILNPEREAGISWRGKPFGARAGVWLGGGRGDCVIP